MKLKQIHPASSQNRGQMNEANKINDNTDSERKFDKSKCMHNYLAI